MPGRAARNHLSPPPSPTVPPASTRHASQKCAVFGGGTLVPSHGVMLPALVTSCTMKPSRPSVSQLSTQSTARQLP